MFDTCDTGKGQMNVDRNETYVLSNDMPDGNSCGVKRP